MGDPLVLTFDIGTQSARGLLVDALGNVVSKVQKVYDPPYISRNPGWAEQRADFYWEAICETSQALKAKHPDLWDDVLAISVTTIRNTVVCVDKDGVPLHDVILWSDQRQATNTPVVPASKQAIFKAIGMLDTINLQNRSAHCNWLKYHEPQLWDKTHKFLLISTYLIYKMTGFFSDCDASLTGHVPFNYKERRWQAQGELTRFLFDIEPDKLCDVVRPGDIVGTVTSAAAEALGVRKNMEVVATGPDKGCETLGLSCNTQDKAALSFGTTATMQVTLDRYLEALPFIPPYPGIIPNTYCPEVQISRGYWLVSWFRNEFATKEREQAAMQGVSPEQLLNERLAEIPPGCDGLVFQPFFSPGVNMPTARGSIIGFSDSHTRIHIYRAIIEGISFALLEGLRSIEKRGKFNVKEIYVAGGGSQSDEICQITANIFGLPVKRVQTHEVCGLGSSMVALTTKGVFKNLHEASERMVHVKDEFLPDRIEHEIYDKLYNEVFCAIFGKLLPLYKKASIYQKAIHQYEKLKRME